MVHGQVTRAVRFRLAWLSTRWLSLVAPIHPKRKIVILTDGYSNPVTAKTAASVIRYREDEVVAVLDAAHVGKMAAEVLGVGARTPFIASLDDAADADTLLIGTAPKGGRIPPAWRPYVVQAIQRGMTIVSGLHDFLADDPELATVASDRGVQLVDLRRNDEGQVATGQPLGDDCLRIQTVGNDCCVGKMVVAIELAKALHERGSDAKFLATGQTGMMIAGEGVPIDCVVADFVSGAAERLVLRNKQHAMLLIEGQGSLAHPMYSAVTLGLLHGCQPQGLILCYEAGRRYCGGVDGRALVSLSALKVAYETAGRLLHPTQVIGVAMNGRTITSKQAEEEKLRVRQELGLPVCDVLRDGPDVLLKAIDDLRESISS